MSRRLVSSAALVLAVAACAGGADTQGDSESTAVSSSAAPARTEPATTPPVVTEPATTEPVATEPRTTTSSVPSIDFEDCAATLPLRERIALLVWPAVYSSDWDRARQTVEQHQVGGVLLMEPVGWGPDDVTTELERLDALASRGLVIATDEEGGVVQRLSVLGPLPSQQAVSEERDPDQAEQLVTEHGKLLAGAGVDMVLGPVVDVVPTTGEVPLTRSRFFTGDPPTVVAYGGAYIAGWQSNGLTPVIKHFPGHGAASGDTHDEPGVTPGLDELEQRDLLPFQALADSGAAVMVGHLTVPGLTDGLPATQSERAVRYLRAELGYADALVLTDALGMQAVGLPEDEASVLALAAGIDVVIFTATGWTAAVIDAIERAVGDGTLPEDRITISAARVMRQLDGERSGCRAG